MNRFARIAPVIAAVAVFSVTSAAPAFAVNYAVPNPSTGSLLTTTELIIPANANDFYLRGIDNEWDEHLLGDVDECELMGNANHVYDIQSVKIETDGEYTFRVVSTSTNASDYYPDIYDAVELFSLPNSFSPIEDPFIAIYEGGFDASNPDANVVGCNDDGESIWGVIDANDGGSEQYWVDYLGDSGTWDFQTDQVTINGNPVARSFPEFSTHLDAGEYTVLITVWDAISSDDWETGTSMFLDWTPGAASVDMEIWGPAAGATLSDGEWDIIEPLASTGGATDTANTVFFAGLVALVLGVGFAATIRRRKA